MIFQRVYLECLLKTNRKKIGMEGGVDMSGTEKNGGEACSFNIENAERKD